MSDVFNQGVVGRVGVKDTSNLHATDKTQPQSGERVTGVAAKIGTVELTEIEY